MGTALWLVHHCLSDCFLIDTGPPAQGWPYSQWAGPSLINHWLRTCPIDLPILWRHFLHWGLLVSDDFSLHQVDIRLASMRQTSHLQLEAFLWFIYLTVTWLKFTISWAQLLWTMVLSCVSILYFFWQAPFCHALCPFQVCLCPQKSLP